MFTKELFLASMPASLSHQAIKTFLVFLLMAGSFFQSAAQADTSAPKKRYMISGLPVLFYTPETRMGAGASLVSFFNFRADSALAPRSSISLGFAYTQNRQVLSYLPYNLFIRNRQWHLYGELGFNRFNYNFFGVGNMEPDNYVERYFVEFSRLRVTLLKRLHRFFYAGGRYAFDNFRFYNLATGGLLESGQIMGSGGGIVSGLGAVFLADSRDNVYYPSRGWWAELVVFRDHPATGSSFNYTRIAFDACRYFHLDKNVFALNFYTLFSDTDMPFFQMATLGGAKRMRGFYEGRYRGNNAIALQAEYRRHLFWIFGFTVFANMGQVADRYDRFNHAHWRYTYGAGLRLWLDEGQKINLRFDVGIGNGRLLPYFTVGEAF